MGLKISITEMFGVIKSIECVKDIIDKMVKDAEKALINTSKIVT